MRPAPGWVEQPAQDGEHARWCYRFANGASLTAALVADSDRRGVRLWSGPGLCHPETADHAELYLAAQGLLTLGDWVAAAAPEPPPAAPAAPDLTLFPLEVSAP